MNNKKRFEMWFSSRFRCPFAKTFPNSKTLRRHYPRSALSFPTVVLPTQLCTEISLFFLTHTSDIYYRTILFIHTPTFNMEPRTCVARHCARLCRQVRTVRHRKSIDGSFCAWRISAENCSTAYCNIFAHVLQ